MFSYVSCVFTGETNALQENGHRLCSSVFHIFIPVVVKFRDAINLLIFIGEAQKIVRQAEEDYVVNNFQRICKENISEFHVVFVNRCLRFVNPEIIWMLHMVTNALSHNVVQA